MVLLSPKGVRTVSRLLAPDNRGRRDMLSLDSREHGCDYLGIIEVLVIRNSSRPRECSHLSNDAGTKSCFSLPLTFPMTRQGYRLCVQNTICLRKMHGIRAREERHVGAVTTVTFLQEEEGRLRHTISELNAPRISPFSHSLSA